jgi:lipopolysaccharide transport system ATP-binding protein
MSKEIVLSLKNVSKCYKRYARPVDRLKEILLPEKNRAEEFWALRDVNLEVLKGETLGIVGQNGSGKSTLLQVIAGTLTPTTGEVLVSGRISALLELGCGFNPEFTGRQNVFFNGQLLGLNQKEIENKFDDIAAFADIGDFLDQPVKTYSSGMFVRLAFAVAVSFNPDILIVDEALAVGDIYFQQKCFERLRELKRLGTTLLFVSHDTGAVYNLCDKAILIEAGRIVLKAKSKQVIDLYVANLLKKADSHSETLEIKTFSEAIPFTSQAIDKSLDNVLGGFDINVPEVKIEFVNLLNEDNQKVNCVTSDQFIQLSVGILFLQSFDDPHVGFKIRDKTGADIFATNTFDMKQEIGQVNKGTLIDTRFKFYVGLIEGEYTITVGAADSRISGSIGFTRTLAYVHNTAVLKVFRNKEAILWTGVVNLNPSLTIHRHAYV